MLELLPRAASEGSPLSKYEIERLQRIEANRKRMEELGVLETARNLMKAINDSKPPRPVIKRNFKPRALRSRAVALRRSDRLVGKVAEYGEIKGDLGDDESRPMGRVRYNDDCEDSAELDDLLAGDDEVTTWEPAKQEQYQEIRCSSSSRGSMYDSRVGITCHFCRQKKLCGEEGCPRCSRRSVSAECIGKTECSRCHGATGHFCRACLLLRYGQTMEEAREQMAKGEWLCPHCYEDEHPDEGWMCNSSICMKRRGFKPTGIAIYDAQQRGHKSVAHWLQAQLKRRGGAAAVLAAGGDAAEGEQVPAAGAESTGANATAAAPARRSTRRSSGPAAATAEAPAPADMSPDALPKRGRASSGGSDQEGGKRRGRVSKAAVEGTTASASDVAADSKAATNAKRSGRGIKRVASSEGVSVDAAGAAGSREGSNEPSVMGRAGRALRRRGA